MTEVEKNDVDINKLFIWGKKYDIVNAQGEVVYEVYMRLLGDADLNRTRVHALRKSQELRKKLRDVNSDERMLYVREKDELSKDELVYNVIALSMRDINNRAVREVKVPRPKAPKSDAKLEKMEKYQAELDEFPKKFQEALQKFIKTEVDKLKKALDEQSEDELYKMYLRLQIDEFCELEAYNAYKQMELYLGCYKDPDYTERVWDTFEKFENFDHDMKAEIRAAYETLDIRMDELKKLQEATQ
jgi:hypothetical protein